MIGNTFAFLVCSERSGSNLITSMLNGHSAVSAPPPSHLFRLFATNAQNYEPLENDHNWHMLLQDVLQAFEAKLGSWDSCLSLNELLARDLERSIVAPIAELYREEAAQDQARKIFVKENHTARFASFLQAQMPGCQFVWMVRDPRDVASSYISSNGIPGGIERAVDVWLTDQLENLHLSRDADIGLHYLKYESLLEDTQGTLSEICRFLGLEFQRKMLDFHQDARTRRNAQRIDAWQNIAQPVLNKNAGKYRQTLKAEEIEYVEMRCYSMMLEFGYRPEIVLKMPEAKSVAHRIEALRPFLRTGTYGIETQQEIETRRRRLAAIETVRQRRPPE